MKCFVSLLGRSHVPCIPKNTRWKQNATTVAGGNGEGNGLNQLSWPCGMYVDNDQTIYVPDTKNHRIVEWKKGASVGRVVAGGNGPGNRNDQLDHPVKVLIDEESDSFIISDRDNHRVVRWPRRNGTSGQIIISNINCEGLALNNNGDLFVANAAKHEVRQWKKGEQDARLVAGGHGYGNGPNQLTRPYYLFLDEDQSVYTSDEDNDRVMKWDRGVEEGIVVAGGNDRGSKTSQFHRPCGLIVDQRETIYIADLGNDRVMRWYKGSSDGSVIVGENGRGTEENQFNEPVELSFDQENNLYVVDRWNHRVQKFEVDV